MRVLSGTQPSADRLHIGNYFGALRQQVAFHKKYETLIFIADLHSMNSVRSGAERRRCTQAATARGVPRGGNDAPQAVGATTARVGGDGGARENNVVKLNVHTSVGVVGFLA